MDAFEGSSSFLDVALDICLAWFAKLASHIAFELQRVVFCLLTTKVFLVLS